MHCCDVILYVRSTNEWYAAQTSKKIRAVWAMKASKGKRISSAVPYGYVKDPDDHEKWHIDENTWLRVQELRSNKRRPTATGRKSLFSGLVYCYDCGAKLHFCAAKSLKRDQEHFRCSNYKSGRGKCSVHFIRDVVLEKIVYEAVSGLADFVRCYESDFLIMQEQKETVIRKKELQAAKNQLEQAKRRVAEIDLIISRIYEDNISGKISDERFSKMSATYEAEQKELEKSITDCEEKLKEADKAAIDLRMLLNGLREFSMVRELTPTIVNTLIQRIEIHNNDKSSGHCYVKVDIYFTAVGMIDIPTKQELEQLRADYLKRMQSA